MVSANQVLKGLPHLSAELVELQRTHAAPAGSICAAYQQVSYNPPSPKTIYLLAQWIATGQGRAQYSMNAKKLEHFKTILTAQLRQLTNQVSDDRAAAIESADDDAKDVVDRSQQDVNQELALQLGERASRMIGEIDQALSRIDEGRYGKCQSCGKEIEVRRLEAVARRLPVWEIC